MRVLETDIKFLDRHEEMLEWLRRAEGLYGTYGGCVFASGIVTGRPYLDDCDDYVQLHWSGRIFAEIGGLHTFEAPVHIDRFSDFIRISRQGAITPVNGDAFDRLKSLLAEGNALPAYISDAVSSPMPLRSIDDGNWLESTRNYRRQFFLEDQFRKFYVDYFLKALSGRRSLRVECACYKGGALVGYVDNVISLSGLDILIEVKLNMDAERDLTGQLSKYCTADEVYAGKARTCPVRNLVRRYAIVMDVARVMLFDSHSGSYALIAMLDDVKTEKDIMPVGDRIVAMVGEK